VLVVLGVPWCHAAQVEPLHHARDGTNSTDYEYHDGNVAQ